MTGSAPTPEEIDEVLTNGLSYLNRWETRGPVGSVPRHGIPEVPDEVVYEYVKAGLRAEVQIVHAYESGVTPEYLANVAAGGDDPSGWRTVLISDAVVADYNAVGVTITDDIVRLARVERHDRPPVAPAQIGALVRVGLNMYNQDGSVAGDLKETVLGVSVDEMRRFVTSSTPAIEQSPDSAGRWALDLKKANISPEKWGLLVRDGAKGTTQAIFWNEADNLNIDRILAEAYKEEADIRNLALIAELIQDGVTPADIASWVEAEVYVRDIVGLRKAGFTPERVKAEPVEAEQVVQAVRAKRMMDEYADRMMNSQRTVHLFGGHGIGKTSSIYAGAQAQGSDTITVVLRAADVHPEDFLPGADNSEPRVVVKPKRKGRKQGKGKNGHKK